jgi:hypothetical protein
MNSPLSTQFFPYIGVKNRTTNHLNAKAILDTKEIMKSQQIKAYNVNNYNSKSHVVLVSNLWSLKVKTKNKKLNKDLHSIMTITYLSALFNFSLDMAITFGVCTWNKTIMIATCKKLLTPKTKYL